jgi:hypothetical protein
MKIENLSLRGKWKMKKIEKGRKVYLKVKKRKERKITQRIKNIYILRNKFIYIAKWMMFQLGERKNTGVPASGEDAGHFCHHLVMSSDMKNIFMSIEPSEKKGEKKTRT